MARPNSSDGKTEATLAKMCRAYGSGQPPADPYGYVEEADRVQRRVQTGYMGNRIDREHG